MNLPGEETAADFAICHPSRQLPPSGLSIRCTADAPAPRISISPDLFFALHPNFISSNRAPSLDFSIRINVGAFVGRLALCFCLTFRAPSALLVRAKSDFEGKRNG